MKEKIYLTGGSKRNTNIDLAKIIACIAVVGAHTLKSDASLINSSLYYLCTFAIGVFFMSSGYILLNRRRMHGEYCIRKILMILRVVVSWSFLIALEKLVFHMVAKRPTGVEDLIAFPKLVVDSLLQRDVLWQFWYLGALMIIYAVLVLLHRLQDYLLPMWIVLVVISCGIQIASYVAGTPLQSRVIQTFRVWTWFQYFILGGMLGSRNIARKIEDSARRKGILLHTVCLFVLTVMVVCFENVAGKYLIHNSYAEYFYDSLLVIIWIIVLFTWILKLRCSGIVADIVELIAPITMGIYILHPLIIKVAGHFVVVNTIGMSLVFFVGILVAATIAAAILSKIPVFRYLIKL